APVAGLETPPLTGRAPALELRLLNHGHPPPLLLAPDGTVTALEPDEPALPLGLAGLGGPAVRPAGLVLDPGAVLLLYTDGVNEARDSGGHFYDPATRLRSCPERDPGPLLDWLLADLAHHGGLGSDDLAVLAVRAADPRPGLMPGRPGPGGP
uniref:SpoIIE family protein phosphatase n=1 Tax=Streptomyces otsuchiensis TaxID=2681388 RepID=UPI0013007843